MVHEETDVDGLISRNRRSEPSFGIVFDSKTKQHVSYPSISNDIEEIISCPELEHDEVGVEKTVFPTIFNTPLKKRKLNKYHSQKTDNCIQKWIARGKTFRHNKKLKMAGFQWDKKRKLWYTFQNPNLDLKDVIIYRVDLPRPLNASVKDTQLPPKSVNCGSFRWVAKGNTYPVKEELKKAGMCWDPSTKEWHSDTKPNYAIRGITFSKKTC